MSNLSTLPPTTESFSEVKVKRAHLLACTWMNALSSEPPDMPPEGFWLLQEATQSLSPATVPCGVTMAPDDILKFIKCQCESESLCFFSTLWVQ